MDVSFYLIAWRLSYCSSLFSIFSSFLNLYFKSSFFAWKLSSNSFMIRYLFFSKSSIENYFFRWLTYSISFGITKHIAEPYDAILAVLPTLLTYSLILLLRSYWMIHETSLKSRPLEATSVQIRTEPIPLFSKAKKFYFLFSCSISPWSLQTFPLNRICFSLGAAFSSFSTLLPHWDQSKFMMTLWIKLACSQLETNTIDFSD